MANSQGAVARTTRQPARTDRPTNRPRMNDPTRMLQTDFDRTFDRFSRFSDMPRLLDLFGPSSDLTSALGDETVPRVFFITSLERRERLRKGSWPRRKSGKQVLSLSAAIAIPGSVNGC